MLRELWRLYESTGRPGGRPNLTRIIPNLLVGEYPTPDDAAWLCSEHQVTAVFNLQDDADLAGKGLDLRDLQRAYREHHLGFHRVPIPDGDMDILAARLDRIVGLLGQLLAGEHCVYLHCNAGRNRAPTVAIAYLHVHGGLPLAAARDFVKERRPCVPYMQVLKAHYG
ncbi:MAG: dual specificity protein phosphatase family protein [Deltaproteobacteria bacterium]|nr:dual specificity protein phosphatase family protein [Deltaproteobacteria bacterium]